MTKAIFTLLISVYSLTLYAQREYRTEKYAGQYCYGDTFHSGCADIYPESDSSILFYLSYYAGPPYYSLGELYDRVVVNGDSGLYSSFKQGDIYGCKFVITFLKDLLTINTMDDKYDCPGFGAHIMADESFKRIHSKQLYFINLEQDTVYFTIPPEKWRVH
jgi:hypothetical protein